MTTLLQDPLIQTALLPLLGGFAGVGLFRLLGGRRMAAAGVLAAFLAAFVVIVGVPALPPPTSTGRLFWSAVAGLGLGLVADLAGLNARRAGVLVGIWLAASLTWLALPKLPGGIETLAAASVLAAIAWLVLSHAAKRGESAAAPGITLLAAAVAVGGVALAGASASIAQLAFALAAATGGLLLWNWPVQRHGWGTAGQSALGVIILLAAALTFFTSAHVEALLLAVPAIFADRLRNRLALSEGLGTVVLAVFAVLPAAASVGLAFLLSAGTEVSGY